MKKLFLILAAVFMVNFTVSAQTFSATYTPVTGAIPDGGAQTCFPITVSGVGAALGLTEVVVDITHGFDADLDIYLKGPDGTLFELSTDNGSSGDNYTGTKFKMVAPRFIWAAASLPPYNVATGYRPEGCGGFNTLNYANPDKNGVWELCITDDLAGTAGNLNSWSLTFGVSNNNLAPSDQACTSPIVCAFNNYTGITYPASPGVTGVAACYTASPPSGVTFCGSIENNSWLQFTASASTVVLEVNVQNCDTGSGIQFSVYSAGNCATGSTFAYATGVSGTSCDNNVPLGVNTLTFSGLTAGTTYYMMVDGNAGAVCNYVINPISGVSGTLITPSVPSDEQICQGESVTLTASSTEPGATYIWSSFPVGFAATGSSVTVSPTETTTYFVTATIPGGICIGEQTASTVVTVYEPVITTTASLLGCTVESATLTLTNPPATDANFTVAAIPYAPLAHTGTNVSLGDDVLSAAFPIGFNFTFYGNTYSDFKICSNGYIGFGGVTQSFTPQTLPTATNPNNLIALAWDDLGPHTGGTIRYETTGTAPNRILKVSFSGVPFFGSTTQFVTGQILLYETTNYIDIICIQIDNNGGGNKTQGIENATGTVGIGAPGKNNAAWSCAGTAVRFAPPAPNVVWSNGVTGATSITVTDPGTYYVTADGCQSNSIVIGAAASVPLLPELPNLNACEPQAVNARVSNPISSDTYSWTGPGGFTATTPTITISVAGTYTVTVTRPPVGAEPACIRTKSFTLTIPAPPTITVNALYDICEPLSLDADPTNVNLPTTVYTWTNVGTGEVLAFTGDIATLNPGVYFIKASNGSLCETTSPNFTLNCPVPTINASFNATTSLIEVSWNDIYGSELGFQLQRTDSLADGIWTTIPYIITGSGNFPANILEFRDAEYTKGKTYCYRVRYILTAFAGSSDPNYGFFSNVACIKIADPDEDGGGGLPPYEYKFTGSAGNQSATLVWEKPKDEYGFEEFDVYFSIAPHDANVRIGTITGNSFTIPGLLNGREYNFKVRARYKNTVDYYKYSEQITLRPSIILGEDGLKKEFTFDIIPNPNNGEFELNLSGMPSDKVEIQIVNVAGQVVMSKNIDGFTGAYHENVRLENIANGLYFIRIDTDNASMQKKVSIVR